MMIFISRSDLSYPFADGMSARKWLENNLESRFGCPCVVLDMCCDGLIATGEQATEPIKVLFLEDTLKCADDSTKKCRKMLRQLSKQGTKNQQHHTMDAVSPLVPFSVGILTTYLIKLLKCLVSLVA